MTLKSNLQRPADRGIIPLLIVAIVAAVLALGGVATYYVVKKPAWFGGQPKSTAVAPGQNGATGDAAGQPAAALGTPQGDLNAVKVEVPKLDFSTSSLPALDVSAVNPTAVTIGNGKSPIASFKTNTDFSYKGDYTVAVPEVKLDIKAAPAAASAPTGSSSGSGSTGGGSTGGSGSGGTSVNAANCGQFSAMPSAQYCSNVSDPTGQTLCQQCKAAGF